MRWAAAALLALCSPIAAQADSQSVPPYLALARQLVEHTRPDDNRYVLGKQFISLPGDSATSTYAVQADCSGFLLAILARAHYPTQSRMAFLPGKAKRRTRPAAEDFVFSIETQQGFQRITDGRNMRPGDLLAHAMLNADDQRETGTTGHVFLVDSAPKAIQPREPVVTGTRQYEIAVIDSNEEHVGADDTRLANPDRKVKGLGRGTIRIYLDDQGKLVGWARTFKTVRKFFSYDDRFPSDTKLRKAAIGRPVAGI
jgi:hypothetical protein